MDILHHRVPGSDSREITKRTVKDQVADKIASMIQTGLLQPGDELPSERELCEQFGVVRNVLVVGLRVSLAEPVRWPERRAASLRIQL